MARGKFSVLLPPSTIIPGSQSTVTSSVSDSLKSDYVFKSLPYQKVSRAAKMDTQSPSKASRRKDFRRAPHVQAVMDRIHLRRLNDAASKKAKDEDPQELRGVLEQFSKYDTILDHLVKKNKSLRTFVKTGDGGYLSGEVSLTTADVLHTLNELRLQRQKTFAKPEADSSSMENQHGLSPVRGKGSDKDEFRFSRRPTHKISPERAFNSKPGLRSIVPKEVNVKHWTSEDTSPDSRGSEMIPSLSLSNNATDVERSTLCCYQNKLPPRFRRLDSPLRRRSNPVLSRNGWTPTAFPRINTKPRTGLIPTRRLHNEKERLTARYQKGAEFYNSKFPITLNTTMLQSKSRNVSRKEESPGRSKETADSRDEQLSPQMKRHGARSTFLDRRASPPRREFVKIQVGKIIGSKHLSDEISSIVSDIKDPREHFLPVSPPRKDPFLGEMESQQSSVSPSEKARQLMSQVDKALIYSRELRFSQDRLGHDLLQIKDRYRKRNESMNLKVREGVGVGGVTGVVNRQKDAHRELGYFHNDCSNIVESEDGIIHIEDLPSLGNKRSSSYRVEDGLILVDEGSAFSETFQKEDRFIEDSSVRDDDDYDNIDDVSDQESWDIYSDDGQDGALETDALQSKRDEIQGLRVMPNNLVSSCSNSSISKKSFTGLEDRIADLQMEMQFNYNGEGDYKVVEEQKESKRTWFIPKKTKNHWDSESGTILPWRDNCGLLASF